MRVVSVVEAAKELNVSPRRVRQMLADGELPGERVGRAWVIDAHAVGGSGSGRRRVGRPWSSASAWAVLSLADDMKCDLAPFERLRARNRLALGLPEILARLGARAERKRLYAHPGVVDRLAVHPDVVRSGVSALAEHGVDLVAGDAFEGYVRSSQLPEIARAFALDGNAARPNVVLHIVDDSEWPFPSGEHVAGPAVVAVDLLESVDPRSRRAGVALLERV